MAKKNTQSNGNTKESTMVPAIDSALLEQFQAMIANLPPDQKRAIAKQTGILKRGPSEPTEVVIPDGLTPEAALEQYKTAAKKAREVEAKGRQLRQAAHSALAVLCKVDSSVVVNKKGKIVEIGGQIVDPKSMEFLDA